MKFTRSDKNQLKRFFAILIFSALLLVSCAAPKSETDVNSNSENKSVETANQKNENPESNLLNACLVLPKSEVEKILGRPLTSANLSKSVEGNMTTAALSQCTFQTNDGQTIEFFARRSPVADNTPEAIQQVRDTMKKVTQKEVEDVGGVGDTAFWVPVVNQLHVFAGGKIYFYFTMREFKNVSEARAKSIELARQALNSLSVN